VLFLYSSSSPLELFEEYSSSPFVVTGEESFLGFSLLVP
jgi:hypothetical protein